MNRHDWWEMQAKRIEWVITVALLFVFLGGCASIQQPAPNRNPYRTAMLNTDFSSAYPRRTDWDPFGYDESVQRERTGVAERRRDSADTTREQVAAMTPPLAEDSIYDPFAALGYIQAVYQANETSTGQQDSDREIIDIYRFTQDEGTIYHSTRPAVGDLVFFHNTFDRNADGRANDWYTHLGVVESVDQDGNISILSYLDDRVSRTHLNLERPGDARADDAVINTAMRQRRPGDPPYTQYLASELFAGFGSLLGERTEFLVIDNWQPGMSVAQQ